MTIVLAEWILRIAMAGFIIWRKRSPAAALAWLVVVAFVPVVGAFLYFLVGENRLGRRRLSRHQSVVQQLTFPHGASDRYAVVWQPQIGRDNTLIANLAESVGAEQPLGGNSLKLISQSEDFVEALVEDIDAAQEHCHLLYYIFNEDDVGRRVAQALTRAARRGITCRLLLDAVGSQDFLKSSLRHGLDAEAGMRVEPALPVKPLRAALARLDLRNHRKLAVIDGRLAYTGSHNISGPIYPRKARYGAWVDATVRVEGPSVRLLQEVFLQDWYDATEEEPADDSLFPQLTHREATDIAVQVLPTGPHMQDSPLLDVLLQSVRTAREDVIFTTPYFVPNDIVLASLRSAAMRGVNVTLVLPRFSDSPLAQAAGRSHYAYLLEVGIHIHEFTAGLLHSKTLTVDRSFAAIGSANLDVRSFDLNFEVELLVYDSDFASQLRFLQQTYIRESQPLEIGSLRERSLLRRFGDNVAKLLTPLL